MKRKKAFLVSVLFLCLSLTFVFANGQEQNDVATDEQLVLSYWHPFSSKLATSLDESIVYQEMEKVTGIKIEWLHPPEGESEQSFNLMIAANDLTDMFYNPPAYPGGPDKAVDDGYYVNLMPMLEDHGMNILKVLESNSEIKRQVLTDEGNLWGIPTIQMEKEPPWSGLFLRKDWLNDLGLDVPVTIADWEEVLVAFKDVEGCEYPLLVKMFDWRWGSNDAFAGAFGASIGDNGGREWINKDGTVVFGPAEPGYEDFLRLMNRWFEMGLIDPDFATRDKKSHDALFTSGKAGVFISGYGDVGPFTVAGKTSDADFDIVAAPMPIAYEGADMKIRQSNPYNREHRTIISGDCIDKGRALEWIDYTFTDEGFLLFNYGVEGVTYDLVSVDDYGLDGGFFPDSIKATGMKPEYNEFMTNNPEGYDFWDLVSIYKVHHAGMLRNPLSYLIADSAYDAMEIWSKSSDEWVMPPVVRTADESKRYSDIMSEVKTYYQEMTLKMIMGIESIEGFDAYVKQLKALGIGEAAEIQQAALIRYNNR